MQINYHILGGRDHAYLGMPKVCQNKKIAVALNLCMKKSCFFFRNEKEVQVSQSVISNTGVHS